MSMAAGERRVVSVLVADVAASTAIAEQLGPERSKFLFDDVIRLMRQEVRAPRRHGRAADRGTACSLSSAPRVAHEDDAERAVRAAGRAIHQALARGRLARSAPRSGTELGARVAVNTGPGSSSRKSDEPEEGLYNALGDTVNVAARLEERRSPRRRLHRGEPLPASSESSFELQSLGGARAEGEGAHPSTAFVVRGRTRREAHGEPGAAPLVGREGGGCTSSRRHARHTRRGAAVRSSLSQVRPGIGEVAAGLAEASARFGDRVLFLEGQGADAKAGDTPYWPVHQGSHARLARAGNLGSGSTVSEFGPHSLARSGDGEAEEAYPFLATLLGLGA